MGASGWLGYDPIAQVRASHATYLLLSLSIPQAMPPTTTATIATAAMIGISQFLRYRGGHDFDYLSRYAIKIA